MPSAGDVYDSALADGERDCLLFLQPIVRAEKIEFMRAAIKAAESLTAQSTVHKVLGPAANMSLRDEVLAVLHPPSYRLVEAFYQCFARHDPAGMAAAAPRHPSQGARGPGGLLTRRRAAGRPHRDLALRPF